MDLMSLVAKLSLDSSEYMKGLDEAKKAAEEIGAEVKKATDKANEKKKESKPQQGPQPKKQVDPAETFFDYVVKNADKINSVASALETAAKAFQEASKGTAAEGVGAFVGYLVDHKEDLATTAGKVETLATALSTALKTSDDPLAGGAAKIIDYVVSHKQDLDDAAGIITTLAGGLGEAMKGSDNEGVALAGDFLSYMAQNAANLTNPVGVVMTLLVYLVQNWDTISAFFSSVAPAWLLELPENLDTAWNNVLTTVNSIIESLKTLLGMNLAGIGAEAAGITFEPGGGYTTEGGAWWPGAAAGMDYVPSNGYRATLHEGEAVLNKRDAEAWRSGSMLNPSSLGDAIAAAVDRRVNELIIVMDGVTVGKLTAKTVGREQERNARALRYAYG